MDDAETVRGFEGARQFDAESQRLGPLDRSHSANAGVERVARVILHHDVMATRRSGADPVDVDDVRVPGQLTHRALLTQKPFEVVAVEVLGEHFHRDGAVQGWLTQR